VVNLGCTVTVLDVDMNEEEEYRIVGSQEADPMDGRISEESPFGKALMGKEEGNEVTVEAPMGLLHYRILKIAVNR
jgi:transcription elongation factor GreA